MASSNRSPRVRYAVVGLGHLAQASVLPAFVTASTSSVLTALVSGSADKRGALGDRYDVAHRFSYDEFDRCLEHVDAVYLCTPNSEHASFAERAARAGKHVLCEKPMAVTDEECARMIAARDDGGVLFDLGIYCINAARMLFDAEPERVSAFTVAGDRSGMPEVDETASAVLHFAGDRHATFTASFDASDVSAYRVVGTDGQIVVDPGFEHAEPLAYTMTVGDRTTKKKGRKVDQFAAELVYFSRCIRDDVPPEPSGEEGAWDVRIIDALHESARRGVTIALRPFSEPGPERQQALALPAPPRATGLVDVESPHEN